MLARERDSEWLSTIQYNANLVIPGISFAITGRLSTKTMKNYTVTSINRS